MRYVAIVTSLVMAAGSATAQPPKREDPAGRVSYVTPRTRARPQVDRAWIELASSTPVRYGTEFIVVGPDAGRFSQLRIEASAGKVIVRRLRLYYSDRTVQTMALGRTLDPQHRSIVIDLPGKSLDQLAITTETYTSGKYAIYGAVVETGIALR